MELQWKRNWQDDESIDFSTPLRTGINFISQWQSHTFYYFSRRLLKNIIRNEFAQRASQVNAKCNGNQHPIIAYGFLYLERLGMFLDEAYYFVKKLLISQKNRNKTREMPNEKHEQKTRQCAQCRGQTVCCLFVCSCQKATPWRKQMRKSAGTRCEVKQNGARSWVNRGEEKGGRTTDWRREEWGKLADENGKRVWFDKMILKKAGMSDCDWKASRNRRVQMEFKTINLLKLAGG